MVLLWCGVLAGPIVWLTLLEANYVLSYVACERRQTWFLHLGTAIAVTLVALAGLLAWHAGHAGVELEASPPAPPGGPGTSATRARWMALFAVANSIWFIIVIVAMSVPVVVLRTCQ